MKVTSVLRSSNGITLALTDTGHYLVGIGYTLGAVISAPHPSVDFLITKSESVARQFFNDKTGATL